MEGRSYLIMSTIPIDETGGELIYISFLHIF